MPTLVRNGGLIVKSPPVALHLTLPPSFKQTRTVAIFPTPVYILEKIKSGESSCHGSFVLIEDDGISNNAAERGGFTEIKLYFRASVKEVLVGAKVRKAGYRAIWNLIFVLPEGDKRQLVYVKEENTQVVISDSEQRPPHSVTIRVVVDENS